MCCTPSGYIILTLRKLKFYEDRGPDNPKTIQIYSSRIGKRPQATLDLLVLVFVIY